jgi:hypothetical protein
MKKISLLCLAALGLMFLQCGSGSDDPGPGNDDDGGQSVDKSGNLLGIGASANDLLSNTNFDRILVEIAYVNGFRPTDQTMTNFTNFLAEHTFKTAQNISFEYHAVDSPTEDELTFQEIADIETEIRQNYNDGNTIAVFIYFTDATSENDQPEEGLVTLGAVYRNTSMVIFERTVRLLAGQSLSITNTDVETATINHEFGHLFGLVNLGSPAVNDHEDPNASNHCAVNGCLMQAELEFGDGMMKALESRASKGMVVVPTLDAECRLDLQNNGGR